MPGCAGGGTDGVAGSGGGASPGAGAGSPSGASAGGGPGGGKASAGAGGSAAGVGGDVADPVRVRVPAIGVSAEVIALSLDGSGRLVAPERYDVAGWNRAGPEPGETGAAVVAAHMDSRSGPAVFFRLRDLDRGDVVHVDRADGTTVTFTVRRLARYPKSGIPDREVYGGSDRPELRLITCGGTFDERRRSYRDNVIVFAH
ncbi:MAG: class F sortase [Streptosporangiales bacterium]|nr:class F sortase [Streptosporangiales bacterium]